jgi:hypothetical protein
VCSQQSVGHLITKNFHKSISIIVGLSPAVCSKWEFANLKLNTLESEKLFQYKTANLLQLITRDSNNFVTTTNLRFQRLCSDECILFTGCQALLTIQTMKWRDTYIKFIVT